MAALDVAALVRDPATRVIVTCGSSGVGKTTTAAAMALLGAYFYSFLRTGKLFIPLPWLPKTVSVGGALSFWPAAIIAVLLCAAVGLLLFLGLLTVIETLDPETPATGAMLSFF